MLKRICRYQAAIVREDDHILLIQHREHAGGRTYWVVPGGGIEDGESEEACVRREAREETNLDIEVVRLLIDEPAIDDRVYERWKTYLCGVVSGEARPGHEPEPEVAATYGIDAVAWYDFKDLASWGEDIHGDRFTGPMLLRIRAALRIG